MKLELDVRLGEVTFLAPMKRGLKDVLVVATVRHRLVTFLAPMKRGLKVESPTLRLDMNLCNIPCPDEKGTESWTFSAQVCPVCQVTFLAPMKRGLKARNC